MTLCRRPSQYATDPEERRLGKLMGNYISPSSSTFDPEFKAQVEKLIAEFKNP